MVPMEKIKANRDSINHLWRVVAIVICAVVITMVCLLVTMVRLTCMEDHFRDTAKMAEPVVVQTMATTDHPVVEVLAAPQVFVPYDVPLDYQLQKYICEVADYYGVPRELVFGVAYCESSYRPAVSSYGLMGIKADACAPEIELLGVTDLLNPWQNATVGIHILADKLDTYDTTEEALMAFNAGNSKAEEIWFSKGIYSTEYSRAVLAEAERVKK